MLRKLFSARKYFLFQENCSCFETVFLNQDKLNIKICQKIGDD